MTPRQRLTAALNRRPVDRTPVFEYVLQPPAADAILGRPCATHRPYWKDLRAELGWEGAVRRMAEDHLELALKLGHDLIHVPPNPPPDCLDWTRRIAAHSMSDDPVAVVRASVERGEAAEIRRSDEPLLVYRLLAEEMARRGVDIPLLAPAAGHGIWTNVDLMVTMQLDGDVAARHFRQVTRVVLAALERYAELGVTVVSLGGDFAGNRPLISPETYRRFILPEIRTCARRAHELGLYCTNTSDGNLWPVIDDFLIASEVDGYLEIDLHAGMDLPRLKARFGDRITFFGNLDCGNVLSFSSPDEVRRHVVDCLDAGRPTGHVLCASNAVTESVPLANYLAVVAAYRDYFRLPPLSL